jgi:hypothetical protein
VTVWFLSAKLISRMDHFQVNRHLALLLMPSSVVEQSCVVVTEDK